MKQILGVSIAIVIIAAVLSFGHWVIYRAVLSFWQPHLAAQQLFYLRLSFVVLTFSFIATSVVTMLVYNPILAYLYTASSFWLGAMYLLFIASVFGFTIFGLTKFTGGQHIALLTGKSLMVVAVILSIYAVWHSKQIQVVNYKVSLANLPPAWQGKNVVMVADLHLGNIHGQGFAKKVVSKLQSLSPDAVFIPGDFYDGPPADYQALAESFKDLSTTYGVYYADGNHEEFRDSSGYHKGLEAAGIHVLNNKAMEVEGLQIAGVGFRVSHTEQGNTETLQKLQLNPDKPIVLIKHEPSALGASEKASVDLQVSGHAHSGQMWPGPWLTRKIFGVFAYGFNTYKNMQVITTSGVGTWGPPMRLGTNSEIVMITLEKE